MTGYTILGNGIDTQMLYVPQNVIDFLKERELKRKALGTKILLVYNYCFVTKYFEKYFI